RRRHARGPATQSVRDWIHHHAAVRILRASRRAGRPHGGHFRPHRRRVERRCGSRGQAPRGGALMAAESERGGERTEEPSQRRLQEARERGQIPRSRELTNFATMIGGSAALVAIGGSLTARLSQMMRSGLTIDANTLRDTDSMAASLGNAGISAVLAL